MGPTCTLAVKGQCGAEPVRIDTARAGSRASRERRLEAVTSTAEKILGDALSLPEEERRHLVEVYGAHASAKTSQAPCRKPTRTPR
jgi:hypothetical protein